MNNNFTNRVEKMNLMAEDDSVVFRDFTRTYRENRNKFIFLLEGDDDIDYYSRAFEQHLSEQSSNWVHLVCHGRSNVKKLIADLANHTMSEYRNGLYYGFIDKDYHEVIDNPHPEKIYVTPCYSIENFYTSEQFIKKILSRKFFLSENNPINNDFQVCFDNFLKLRNEFLDGVKELDTLLRCNRIMYDEMDFHNKINARDINLENHVNFSLENVTFSKPSFRYIRKKL